MSTSTSSSNVAPPISIPRTSPPLPLPPIPLPTTPTSVGKRKGTKTTKRDSFEMLRARTTSSPNSNNAASSYTTYLVDDPAMTGKGGRAAPLHVLECGPRDEDGGRVTGTTMQEPTTATMIDSSRSRRSLPPGAGYAPSMPNLKSPSSSSPPLHLSILTDAANEKEVSRYSFGINYEAGAGERDETNKLCGSGADDVNGNGNGSANPRANGTRRRSSSASSSSSVPRAALPVPPSATSISQPTSSPRQAIRSSTTPTTLPSSPSNTAVRPTIHDSLSAPTVPTLTGNGGTDELHFSSHGSSSLSQQQQQERYTRSGSSFFSTAITTSSPHSMPLPRTPLETLNAHDAVVSSPRRSTPSFFSSPSSRTPSSTASTGRPISSFFPSFGSSKDKDRERDKDRGMISPRLMSSPSTRHVNPNIDHFLPTPSINDSYAPRVDYDFDHSNPNNNPAASSSSYFALDTSDDVSLRRDRSQKQRASLIHSFMPAPAFSAGDRGPYPPMQRNSSSSLPMQQQMRRVSSYGDREKERERGGGNGVTDTVHRGGATLAVTNQEDFGSSMMGDRPIALPSTVASDNRQSKATEQARARASIIEEGNERFSSSIHLASPGGQQTFSSATMDAIPSDTFVGVDTALAVKESSADLGEEEIDMVGVGRNSFLLLSSATSALPLPTPPSASLPTTRTSPIGKALPLPTIIANIGDANGHPIVKHVPLPLPPFPPPTIRHKQLQESHSFLLPLPLAQHQKHLPPQASICVECMMRDRDMADVDVTSHGVWARESDADGSENEAEDERRDGISEQEGEQGRRATSSEMHSASASASGSSAAFAAGEDVKRLIRSGAGQVLTAPNLNLWTSMTISASADRVRTLRCFVDASNAELDQNALLEALCRHHRHRQQQQERISIDGASDRRRSVSAVFSARVPAATATAAVDRNGNGNEIEDYKSSNRGRSFTSPQRLPNEPFPSRPLSSSSSNIPRLPPGGAANVRTYSSGDQPWLSSRRFSTAENSHPGSLYTTRSSSDLRSISPAGYRSGGGGKDDRRASIWSRFRGGFGASTSVLSLAPSGSMLDMHLGLSMDKHAADELGYHYGGGGVGAARSSSMFAASGMYNSYNSTRSDPMIRYLPAGADDGDGAGERQWSDDRLRESAKGEKKEKGGKGIWGRPRLNRVISLPVLADGGSSGSAGASLSGKEKEKKKGIRGFFSKLISIGGSSNGKINSHRHRSSSPGDPSSRATLRQLSNGNDSDDSLPLPPPLSMLVNEPNHRLRSSSSGSLDFSPSYADQQPQQPHWQPQQPRQSSSSLSYRNSRAYSSMGSGAHDDFKSAEHQKQKQVGRSGSYGSSRSAKAGICGVLETIPASPAVGMGVGAVSPTEIAIASDYAGVRKSTSTTSFGYDKSLPLPPIASPLLKVSADWE